MAYHRTSTMKAHKGEVAHLHWYFIFNAPFHFYCPHNISSSLSTDKIHYTTEGCKR